ncbi:MAG: DNA primase, partial [Desulfobacterales bacterium]|nr:DNA primase [Desulfobacterales bacterium]
MGDVVSIKEKVEARVEEQKSKTGKGSGDELDSDFILRCYHRNELGDGELYARIHQTRFRFNNAMNAWMEWMGNHWIVDVMERAVAGVEDVTEAYAGLARELSQQARELEEEGRPAGEFTGLVKGLRKRVTALQANRRRNNCLLFAHTCRVPLAIEGSEVDQKPWLMPCANGVINLKTGELEDGRPEDYLIKSCPVKWEGIDAGCDAWEKALLEIFSDNINLVRFWQRICGYALVGEVVLSIFVVMTGRGRNGKSLIMETIARVLGKKDFAGPIRAEMLLDQTRNTNASGPSPEIMSLRGLRVAYASETDDGCKVSSARVKL